MPGRLQQRLLDGDLNDVRDELGVPKAEKPKTSVKRDTLPGQRRLARDVVGTDDDTEEAA